jgi:hypothetical protein
MSSTDSAAISAPVIVTRESVELTTGVSPVDSSKKEPSSDLK